jgi:hypothetical protein
VVVARNRQHMSLINNLNDLEDMMSLDANGDRQADDQRSASCEPH